MSETAAGSGDPLEFLKSLWGKVGVPLPGIVTPTLDVTELDKRITDLKAVEGWLKMNLNMLQMSIQGLEVQRATLATFQAIGHVGQEAAPGSHPFSNPALWPWSLMQQAAGNSEEAPPEAKRKPAKPRRRAAGNQE